MNKLPVFDDSIPDEIKCTSCLLPMQYQKKENDKFFWQCFKCGKQYIIPEDVLGNVEERWSPPRC